MTVLAALDASGGATLLAALAVVVATARSVGWLVARLGQPRVLGEILAGILLGPTLLGSARPDLFERLFTTDVRSALGVIAQVGLILFVFLLGAELELHRVRQQRGSIAVISAASVLVPLVAGAALAVWMSGVVPDAPRRAEFVLFVAVAMSVTALPVLARIVQETGLGSTRIGVAAITCAAVNDVAAWLLLAGVVALVQADGPGSVVTLLLATVSLVALALGPARALAARGRPVSVPVAVAVAFSAAWVAEVMGVHAIFGAFLAGLVLQHSGDLRTRLPRQLAPATTSVLLPVFFAAAGLSTDVGLLGSGSLWLVAVAVIVVASISKLAGAGVAARLSGHSGADAARFGVLMNTRGLAEIVILSVGLQLGVIGGTTYTIMVLMALATTFAAAPLLRTVDRLSGHPESHDDHPNRTRPRLGRSMPSGRSRRRG